MSRASHWPPPWTPRRGRTCRWRGRVRWPPACPGCWSERRLWKPRGWEAAAALAWTARCWPSRAARCIRMLDPEITNRISSCLKWQYCVVSYPKLFHLSEHEEVRPATNIELISQLLLSGSIHLNSTRRLHLLYKAGKPHSEKRLQLLCPHFICLKLENG